MMNGDWYKGAKDWHLNAFLILFIIGLISTVILIGFGFGWILDHITIK